jgi:crotonobetainyl-CoA:carnitine CoA-transferase CaiB-like acyl-CoA transferase
LNQVSGNGGPLEGVRALDLSTGVAGALAAMLLADFGATVVKVEPPGGDGARHDPAFPFWNRGKRSVVLDRTAGQDEGHLERLLAGADVCVVTEPAPTLAGTVLDPARTTAANPRLVHLSLPPYTDRGTPWAGGRPSHGLLAAATGVARRQSSFSGGPVELIYPILHHTQGIWGAAAAVAALFERERSGFGQAVSVDGVQGMLVAASGNLTIDPGQAPRTTAVGPGGANPSYGPYCCEDGRWLFLGALTRKFQDRAFEALGVKDVLSDPRIEGRHERLLLLDNATWVRQRIAAAFARRPRDEWLAVLEAADCPAGPLGERDGWLDDEQIRAIGMRAAIEDPDRGEVVMPGVPLVLTGTPGAVRGPAPALGELDPRDLDWPPRPGPPGTPPERPGPLAGVRVLDVGTILAGPFTGLLLAELGADVIKVEPPAGDSWREMGFSYSRGQRGLAIDLARPEGRAAFAELVSRADAVVDNYRPGVMRRLGVDHAALVQHRPALVTASITGFGEGGPLSDRPGFDPILQAMSGMMHGQGGDAEPVFFTIAVNDVTAAALTSLGVCLALLHRERRGEGQRLWTSLAGVAAFVQGGELTRYAGRPPLRRGGRDHPGPGPLDRFYAARDGWVRLQAPDAGVLERLGLRAGGQDVAAALAAWCGSLTQDEAVRRLTEAGVPAAPARLAADLPRDPELCAGEVVHVHEREDGSPYYTAGRFARFGRTQRSGALVAPGLGEHSREILADACLHAAAIEGLLRDGVVVEGGPLSVSTFFEYR